MEGSKSERTLRGPRPPLPVGGLKDAEQPLAQGSLYGAPLPRTGQVVGAGQHTHRQHRHESVMKRNRQEHEKKELARIFMQVEHKVKPAWHTERQRGKERAAAASKPVKAKAAPRNRNRHNGQSDHYSLLKQDEPQDEVEPLLPGIPKDNLRKLYKEESRKR